jgi:hypothetical protein
MSRYARAGMSAQDLSTHPPPGDAQWAEPGQGHGDLPASRGPAETAYARPMVPIQVMA